MKTILLSFAFMSFCETGLFKGLRAKNKKNVPPPELASQVVADASKLLSARTVGQSLTAIGAGPHCRQ
jgi:hypothetical protein